MKISGIGATNEPEKGLPASPAAQIAIAFDSDGNQELVAEAPDSHDGRRPKRQQPRRDVRRTAEYLAERGRLPAEALHLLTRRTLAEAVTYIRKAVPGCTHQWAADYYMRAVTELLPYCHIKQSDLDTAGTSEGLHSLLAGHFLAASAFGARSTLDGPAGRGATVSGSQRLLDAPRLAPQADPMGRDTTQNTTSGAVITLPPRGRD